MIKTIKKVSKNIRVARTQGIDDEPFNGFGFMRRVYGVEESPSQDTLETIINAHSSDDPVLEENG